MKLFINYSEDNGGNPYVDGYILARNKQEAISKLERSGRKPDTYSEQWRVEEVETITGK